MNPVILIVDDEESIRKLLKVRLKREGYSVQEACDGVEALKQVEIYNPLTVITDIKMPNMDGFQLLGELNKREFVPSLILITGHGEKEGAIQAVRTGAYDYLEKPFDLDTVVATVKRAVEAALLKKENKDLMEKLKKSNTSLTNTLTQREVQLKELGLDPELASLSSLVGESKQIIEVKKLIERITPSGATPEEDCTTVLITGESGTGKEVAAKMVHDKSARAARPFIAVNCAAFPANLLESELFGHEKGSFTGANQQKTGLFEAAEGGTIFLDEIGEADPKTQASLLRVIQERAIRRVGSTQTVSIDVRILSATNRDLKKQVESGNFREDLYYRLNVINIHLPPLRERGGDTLVLANFFLNKMCKLRKASASRLSPTAAQLIQDYSWPGNVRELQNVIERALILKTGEEISASDLGLQGVVHFKQHAPISRNENSMGEAPIGSAVTSSGGGLDAGHLVPLISQELSLNGRTFKDFRDEFMDQVELELIKLLLHQEGGNVSQVARMMGLDRSNIQRRLKRWNLDPAQFRKAA